MLCRTAISSILDITHKAVITLLFLLLLVKGASAQETADELEIQSSLMWLVENAKAGDAPEPGTVIEAVGTVSYSAVPVYTDADRKSRIIRYAIPGEKVTIVAANEQWYCIRLYNGRVGFVEMRNLRTVKVFYDESVTTNYMDKSLSVELNDLTDKFNATLKESIYLEKFQVVPRLTIVEQSKRNNVITITMEYSAINTNGTVIPSLQENILQPYVQDFIELLFMKMLPSLANSYVVVIRKPVFSDTGQVINTQSVYARLFLMGDDVELQAVRNLADRENRLLNSVESSVGMGELFKFFPH